MTSLLSIISIMLVLMLMTPTLAFASQTPYSIGFAAGNHDAQTKPYDYDSTSACQTVFDNGTAAQVYECLKGYSDGDKSPYQTGYLQGVQGIDIAKMKGTHTPEFMNGYIKGIDAHWSNMALVEGYSGLPMSSFLAKNAPYAQSYKNGRAEYLPSEKVNAKIS